MANPKKEISDEKIYEAASYKEKEYGDITLSQLELAKFFEEDENPKTETKVDPVNPEHYKQGRREAIDIMEDIVSDPAFNGVEGFLVAIAVKYLLRHKHKNGVEDLNKAIWYIKRLIAYNERNK